MKITLALAFALVFVLVLLLVLELVFAPLLVLPVSTPRPAWPRADASLLLTLMGA